MWGNSHSIFAGVGFKLSPTVNVSSLCRMVHLLTGCYRIISWLPKFGGRCCAKPLYETRDLREICVYLCTRSSNQTIPATRHDRIHFPSRTSANLQLAMCCCEKARFLGLTAKAERPTTAIVYQSRPDGRKWPAVTTEGRSQIRMFWQGSLMNWIKQSYAAE